MQINDEEEDLDFPISYSIDNSILMHRDVHFGGSFDLMLDYYNKEGKGTVKDFEIPRIQELYDTEKRTGKNLSALMLTGAEAERVARARQVYQQLKSLYETKSTVKTLPILIADLILAEEEESDAAIKAAAEKKAAIVPSLIDLLKNEEFYDTLFPGYGQAPAMAAKALGMIGDKRAIISLFEAIGEGDFFNEDIILEALHVIGNPARDFLLKVLHGKPLTGDNEKAAIALVTFKDDPVVGTACLQMLKELDIKKEEALATYLILACEGLQSKEERQELMKIANLPTTPKTLQLDIKSIAKAWERT